MSISDKMFAARKREKVAVWGAAPPNKFTCLHTTPKVFKGLWRKQLFDILKNKKEDKSITRLLFTGRSFM